MATIDLSGHGSTFTADGASVAKRRRAGAGFCSLLYERPRSNARVDRPESGSFGDLNLGQVLDGMTCGRERHAREHLLRGDSALRRTHRHSRGTRRRWHGVQNQALSAHDAHLIECSDRSSYGVRARQHQSEADNAGLRLRRLVQQTEPEGADIDSTGAVGSRARGRVRRVDGWVGRRRSCSAAPERRLALAAALAPDGPGSSDTREAVEPKAPEEQATTSKPPSEHRRRDASGSASRVSVVDEQPHRPAPPSGASEDEYKWHTYRVYPSGRPDAVEFVDTYKAFGGNRILRGLNMGLPEGMV